ncbi:hypothetical protein PRUPE_3G186900 [Prunus persica]|nr:uncharacterized protein LOC18783730 isoform X2 [Prunus persica]XP_020416448.1 uncharacterized protein LOC18783730 isoform X2 [Prunus persica]ONI17929.1 hypothetical protein PRUPE_3G186900 [Prunus persica]ONI17930.1 hypothetical protein PRUPE_3G186900 [Prunus persica]ONI17931.1 hypothetical protein PRUPE_3G186900 [Prunus persica]ONI17932.1 hypothetical protein PRUPE_3G186900 [Prunus persica]ONI17933.1 hypothetical protein PRUPE_3G186900 [Prunus persica]
MISLEGFEPVAVSPHKQDPAWKHCQLFIKDQPNGVKAELKKCIYCGKVFQGGGINRLKSHLAGRKGNGPTCDQTPPDVRLSMLQSLDHGIAAFRHRKSQIVTNSHHSPSELDNSFAENGECKLMVGPDSTSLVNQEEDVGMSGNGVGLSGNLTNVPLEVDNSYRSNAAMHRSAGVPILNFSVNQEEDAGMSVDRRVRWRGGTSSADTGSGSVDGVTKLSNVSAPIPIAVGSAFSEDTQGRSTGFPNSYWLENEEEVGISNTNVSARKRVRGESAVGAANAGTVDNNYEVKEVGNQQIHMAIGRFLYEIQAPLDVVKNSVYFQPMIDAIASGGKGTIAPSYDDLRGWILKNAVGEVKSDIHQHMETWARTGCSLLVNQWSSEKGKTLLNFAVQCPEGTIYLKSVDASYFIFSPDALFEFLKEVVEEVGVGHVLQVITNTEEQFAVAGKRLMDTFPTLYWSPCVATSIDLILEDFGKVEWINSVIEQARSVTRFIYKHVVILNMMRRYTFGNDIVRLGVTRFATNFTTLKQMADLKFNLQSMVTSKEWMCCPYSKTPEGSAVLDVLSNHSFWSACILVTHLTNPLLRVLRIVGSQKRAAMGYVFAGIYRAKETIKRELVKREEYMVYWDIIDYRWKKLWPLPLHAAGFYLNPKFFYSVKGDLHNEIISRMFDCIERLVPDIKIQDEVIKEINLYKNAVGDLGRNLAVRARDNLLPAEWWSTYGSSCPNLARLAIRILSQTCSIVQGQENQIPFELLHKTRNSLECQRLSDLVFVQYNLKLKQKVHKHKEQENVGPISFDRNSIVEDWVTEMEMPLEDNENPDWMSLDPPSGNTRLLELSVDEAEDLGSGFDDNEIFIRLKVVQGEC